MRRVIIESPYAGKTDEEVERNVRYLRACMADCFTRNEASFASHGLYTQPGVLDDKVPEQRALGIRAGFEWRAAADATVVYTDLGITSGMRKGIDHATSQSSHDVQYRTLGPNWDKESGR
jgi:hypothetical protein